jgi:CBS domain containing-hemolysin-like protein
VSWVLLAGMVVLVIANGFFVAAEFALVRARRSRLEEVRGDDRRAVVALREIDSISEYLSSCQLGITLASIGIGFLGEPALAGLLEPVFGGPLSHGAALALSLVVAYLISTALHITIGEQVPKLLAISTAERMAMRVARPLHVFTRVFRPAVYVLNGVSNAILRTMGVDPAVEFEEGGTTEDLKLLIGQSRAGGTLAAGEAEMLAGVLRLREQHVRHVMTPVPAIVTVDDSASLDAAADVCAESGHTRLVVTAGGNRDRILGILHASDIIRGLRLRPPHAGVTVASLVRPAPVVPETTPVDAVLANLQLQRSSMAVVIDEYGRTAGIVTVEDVLEEIVGEIVDETDALAEGIQRTTDGEWHVDGHVPISDLADHGVALPASEAVNSVGGLVFAQLGRLPKAGDSVRLGDYLATVRGVSEQRVESVLLRRVSPEA